MWRVLRRAQTSQIAVWNQMAGCTWFIRRASTRKPVPASPCGTSLSFDVLLISCTHDTWGAVLRARFGGPHICTSPHQIHSEHSNLTHVRVGSHGKERIIHCSQCAQSFCCQVLSFCSKVRSNLLHRCVLLSISLLCCSFAVGSRNVQLHQQIQGRVLF